ncbi:LysM peptidoglycan-binding domain-containing protein [Parasediminibacterium sp. JCM 36343]|uniref:LysM peptidoglycan-binding domain-containing protein n=1 Tax=Parasediminibacterium sp. JCM 36343 TaxID=3374279 RepID=UPI00397DD8C5
MLLPSPRKITLFIALFTCFVLGFLSSTQAQTGGYTLHTIKPNETLSILAKANHTTVGDIMRLNGMNTKSVLKLGDIIKIPDVPKDANAKIDSSLFKINPAIPVKQNVAVVPAKPLVQVVAKRVQPALITTTTLTHYTVVKGDNLYKLSKQYKVPEPQLMEWNNMKTDKLSLGQVLIVGKSTSRNAKVDAEPAPAAVEKTILPKKNSSINVEDASLAKQPFTLPKTDIVAKKDTIAQMIAATTIDTLSKASTKVTEATVMKDSAIKAIDTLVNASAHITDEITKIDTSKKTLNAVIVTAIAKDTVVKKSPLLPKQITKDTALVIIPKDDLPKAISNIKAESTPIPKNAKYVNEEGFFATYFNRKSISSNIVMGDAGTFKSSSGWSDKKYYALVNDISQGTIIRITANNKSICAKVLGPLPSIKEDAGYLIRINAASAAALGVDGRFAATINY